MAHHLSARYVFRSGGLPDDLLSVVDFVGDEAISQPFRFVINLVSTDPDIDFEKVVNQKASLLMVRGDEVAPVHGIVTDFQQGRRVSITLGDRYLYRAVLVPRLHRLSFSHQSRIFQNLTVQEIVTKVLSDFGFGGGDVSFKLQGSYSPREYCTQYKESDLQFVQRLLEYEGIRYHFEHDDSRDLLVITDDPNATPAIDSDDTLPYHVGGGLEAAETAETIREFVAHQKIVTGRVVLKDYNYRTPGSPVQTESQMNGDMPGVFYDYGIHVKDAAEGERLAKVRNEEIECQREQMVGASDCLRLRAGASFSLTQHYREGMNQSYLLTHVHHAGRQPDASPFITGDVDIPEYTNGFTCIPATAPYRPPRLTPEPKITGVMTARVESGGGEYASIDDQGRYRVRMPFDLSSAAKGSASKSIRLAQPYSGAGYGMHFPVHADAEMVFACVDGNVDRPLGLSTVPNPSQSSPVASDNRTMNRIVTASDNRIEIEDEKGNERIKLYSPHENSIIQLGAPNLNIHGIGISTDKTVQVYGDSGVLIAAGGGWEQQKNISDFTNGLTILDGVIGVAKAVVGAATGNTRLANLYGFSGAIGSMVAGLNWPGIYLFAQGGVASYSPNGITSLAGPGGAALHSVGGPVDVAASTGISLMTAAGGISLGVGMGGIGLATVSGGVKVFAGAGGIDTRAKTGDVTIESETGGMHIESFDDMTIISSDKTKIESNNNITLQSLRDNIKIVAKKQLHLEGEEGVEIKSKSKPIVILPTKGSTGSPGLKVDGGYGLTTMKHHFRIQVGSAPGGTQIDMYAGGSMSFRSGNNRITMSATGIEIDAIKLDLSAKAILSLKGALNKIG